MKKVSKKNCWRPRLGSGYLKQSPIQSNLSKSTPNLLRIPGSNQSKLVLWVPLPSTVSDFFFFLLPRKKNACHRASFNRGTRRSKLQSQSKSGRGTAMTESMPWIWWMDRRSEARMNEWMNDPEWWMRATVFLFHFFRFFSFFFFFCFDRPSFRRLQLPSLRSRPHIDTVCDRYKWAPQNPTDQLSIVDRNQSFVSKSELQTNWFSRPCQIQTCK